MDARGAVDLSRQAHERSDVDFARDSLHHTLGGGPFQAAPGTHDHNGVLNSVYLADKVVNGKIPYMWLKQTIAQALPAAWSTQLLQSRVNTPDPIADKYFAAIAGGGGIRVLQRGLYLMLATVPMTVINSLCYIRITIDGFSYQGRVNGQSTSDGPQLKSFGLQAMSGPNNISVQTFSTTGTGTTAVVTPADEWISTQLIVARIGDYTS